MGILTAFRLRLRRIILLEKSPELGEIVLNQRRVFTLPSKAGMVFILVLLICFLTATNYNLNLGFAMTYLLAGIAVVNTFFTFRNLAYLKLNAKNGSSGFAGDVVEFPLQIKNLEKFDRFAIHISFQQSKHIEQIIDLEIGQEKTITLSCLSSRRGRLPCPRIQLQTWFPLGLLRAWSTWLPATHATIYPRPEQNAPPLPFIGINEYQGSSAAGNEDFSGVRTYQPGDPPKYLSWKHIARVDLDAGGSLISKQFSGAAQGTLLIDFNSLPSNLDLETRLSRMTSWIIEAERLSLPYEFKLDHIHYHSNQGETHRNACLLALAEYGLSHDELTS